MKIDRNNLFESCVYVGYNINVVNSYSSMNKEKQMRQIQENYARDIERIDEIHESLAPNIKVSLSQNPEKGTWTKEVILTGRAEAKEDEEIKEYVFTRDGQAIEALKNSLIIAVTSSIFASGVPKRL